MTDEFIQQCLQDAASFGLFLAGQPDPEALRLLHTTRERMAAELIPEYGDDVARLIAEAFAATVIRCRAAVEQASANKNGIVH